MTQLQTPIQLPFLSSLVDVRADKSGPRPATTRPNAYDLIGMDGSLRGGIRPLSGAKKVYELDFYADPRHDETSVVNHCQAVNFAIGGAGYGFGFVYRAKRSAGQDSLADVFVDFWNSRTDSDTTFGITGRRVMAAVDPDANMSVSVFGQFVYVFVSGRSPAMFYVLEEFSEEPIVTSSTSSSGCPLDGEEVATYTLQLFGEECGGDDLPGPGKQPFLKSPENSVGLGLLGLPENSEPNRPGHGQIVLTQQAPETNPFYANIVTSSSSSGSPETGIEGRLFESGDYTFVYFLYDSRTSRRSALSEVAQCRSEDFVEAVSSSSGVGSASPDQYMALELIYDSDKFDQCYVYRSLMIQGVGNTNVMSGYWHLDKIIDLQDFQTIRNGTAQDFDPAVTDLRHTIYYYKNEDKQLAVQNQYLGLLYADERMPFGGASIIYEGTMIVSDIKGRGVSTFDGNRIGDSFRGIGEVRFSGATEISPELFSPSDRYIPKAPGGSPIVYREAGGNVMGFGQDTLFHLRRENTYMRFHEMHEGYGIVNNKAADSYGSLVMYMTQRGLCELDSTGQLDEHRVMDYIAQNVWFDTLEDVSMAFDPKMQAMFVHNKTLQHTVVLWMRTSKLTELYDMPFEQAFKGKWPVSPANYSARLQERAMFLQNPPKDSDSEVITGFKPRIFIMDINREKTISGSFGGAFDGESRLTLLDISGDSRFDTNALFTGLAPGHITLDVSSATLGTGLEGAYVYVIDSPTASFIGKKARIKAKINSSTIQVDTVGRGELTNLPSGSRIAISPVYVRWTGHNLTVEAEDGTQFSSPADYFTVKKMRVVSAAFVDVSGPPSTDGNNDNRFRGLAYKGSATLHADSSFPVATDGSKMASVVDGASIVGAAFGQVLPLQGKYGVDHNSLSPSIEIVCPDLDFRMLAANVEGAILPSTRTQRAPIT